MRSIFISYRREDSEGQAGRLFDDLATHFGRDSVFMDVAGIEPGRDFRQAIDQHVASCGVLLAMIGRVWMNAADASGRRRLDDPMDFVRLETAAALKRDIPVIPVLVHGAQMPRADELPQDLTNLAYRNAVELTHARWESDVQVLIRALHPYVESVNKKEGGDGSASATGLAAIMKRRWPAVAATVIAIGVVVGAYFWYQALPAKPEFLQAEQLAKPETTTVESTKPEQPARGRQTIWSSYDFPAPNAGLMAFTIMPDGNPACASYDGGGCLWGVPPADLDLNRLKPLVCGDQHRARWGVTGYEDPKHWCNVAKTVSLYR
jgi:hypothetical protein